MSDLVILRDVPAAGRDRVAALYADAFRAKLRPALGDGPLVLAVLADTLREDRALCAVRDGKVVGVLGFHAGQDGAFDIRHRHLASVCSGWSAWLRLLLLAPLDRHARDGELLLDGVCVGASVRGRGIGTALLTAAVDLARDRAATSVRLSVIDSNPRARALYERLGFTAVRTERTGLLRGLYGFASVTEMVLAVPPKVLA